MPVPVPDPGIRMTVWFAKRESQYQRPPTLARARQPKTSPTTSEPVCRCPLITNPIKRSISSSRCGIVTLCGPQPPSVCLCDKNKERANEHTISTFPRPVIRSCRETKCPPKNHFHRPGQSKVDTALMPHIVGNENAAHRFARHIPCSRSITARGAATSIPEHHRTHPVNQNPPVQLPAQRAR